MNTFANSSDAPPAEPPLGASVAVGLSGGVDSAVAALLLQRSGYRPVGITLWLSGGEGEEIPQNARDAKAVADHLGIEHRVLDRRQQFSDLVIDPFVRDHWNSQTPNPCVRCNERVKWGLMQRWAEEEGVPWFATGHYVERVRRNGLHYLGRAGDRSKDQSYFLWTLSSETLAKTVFPLHGLTKPEVRKLAAEAEIPVAVKRESQDVCFLPDGERLSLLKTRAQELRLPLEPGPIIGLDGKVVGHHEGLPLYTKGQRQGLGVAVGERVWAKEIDRERNEIRLGRRDELYSRALEIEECRWHLPPYELQQMGEPLTVQLRYRSAEILAQLSPLSAGRWKVELDTAAWAVTPGQSAVFRLGDLLVGGGVISRSL